MDPPARSTSWPQVALRCGNAETARRLSVRPETVTSYLGGAMTKLDAHTRHEAVVRAGG